MKGLRLIATGGALPGRTVTNEELSRTVDTSDEWITTRTGIRTRHYCTEGENAATLAIAAAKQALQRSGLAPADIACCVCATLSAPDATPSVACQVQAALALPENRPALDVNAACSGFLYGTAVARTLLEVLNTELAAQGEALQQRRREYLKLLAPRACANYAELSHGAERMSVRYAAQFAPGGLADLLRQRQEEELRAGQSLCGIHREDLELLLDDQPARVYASQGQQRSVVLSLKMAEAAAAAQITGEHPVLLLDDVLSELDEGRKQYLLTCMKEKQTFVTSCDDTDFLKTDGEVYRMDGGVLNRV